MAKVLISFIGRGRLKDEKTRRYEATTYAFSSASEDHVPVSLFGAGLLQHLSKTEGMIDRWLVVGTEQSMWDALLDAVPKHLRDDAFLNSHRKVGEWIQACGTEKATPDEAVLKEWQKDLTDRLGGTKCCCRVVGSCDTPESQQKLWQALNEGVPEGSSVFMDVTHCYRILPLLGSFMVMFLRWERSLLDVDLVYGAWEMRGEDGICPVIHLPLCNKLLRASEAVATMRHTGNYVPLTDCLSLPRDVDEKVRSVAYRDAVQGRADGLARDTLTRIDGLSPALDVPASVIQPMLRERLREVQGEDPGRRMAVKARHALEHAQYLQAIVTLWESIRVTAAGYYGAENPTSSLARDAAQGCLEGNLRPMTSSLQMNLEAVRRLRNAVAHGTKPPDSARLVKGALSDPNAFREIFDRGWSVLQAFWNAPAADAAVCKRYQQRWNDLQAWRQPRRPR